MIKLSIIIVSYNTQKMTLSCIESVYQQTNYIPFEIIVVDNDSTDGSSISIPETFPDLLFISLKENLGFAGANNLAARKARGQYLLLLNPDTLVIDNAIDKLVLFADTFPDNLIYGGRTLFKDYSLNPTSCWRAPSLWSLLCYSSGLASVLRKNIIFDPESYGRWKRNSVREVDIVTGCFLLIKKDFWDQLNGFDPQFFMYGEDADLCLRAAQLGAKPICVPDATIIHYGGASEKIRTDKMVRLFRAKEQLIRRHWESSAALIGVTLIRFSVLSRYWATELLLFFKVKKGVENAYIWREIWRRKREWQT